MTYRLGQYVNNKDPVDQHLHLHLYTPFLLICRIVDVDLSTCRPVDLLMWTLQKIHLPSQFFYFRLDYTYLSIYIFWQYSFVDLSTCRPKVDLVILSTTNIYICHLCVLPKLNCRLVNLSTCRPVDVVQLSRRKIRLGLGLGLVCG